MNENQDKDNGKGKIFSKIRLRPLNPKEETIDGHILGIIGEEEEFAYKIHTEGKMHYVGPERFEVLEGEGIEYKELKMPILNGLHSTSLESAILKVFEEGGELSQVIGKHRGLSGERNVMDEEEALNRIGEELVDLLQTAVTMSVLLERKYNINIDEFMEEHIRKLIQKGYII